MWQSTLGNFSYPLERITELLYYYTPYPATMAGMALGASTEPARLYMPCSANLAAILRLESPAWCSSRAIRMTACSLAFASTGYYNTVILVLLFRVSPGTCQSPWRLAMRY